MEEFGIGYPPRLIGKKIGETIYSLNLLPFGAFVRMPGEIERVDDPRSFSQQSVGKRILIAFGGVLSFWIISAILLTVVFWRGAPVVIEDETGGDFKNPRVFIADVAAGSPAEEKGLEPGDIIKEFKVGNYSFEINQIKQLQELTDNYKGEEVSLLVERGKELLEVSLVPRLSHPEEEGRMGVALVRVALQRYPWYLGPVKGIEATVEMTFTVVRGYIQAVVNLFKGSPTGIKLVGPVGVFEMLAETQQLGLVYFLNFIAVISVHLAIFNILPIPAVDGGRMLFLAIEAFRKKPLPEDIEQRMTAFSFIVLLGLMVWVTIQDLARFF